MKRSSPEPEPSASVSADRSAEAARRPNDMSPRAHEPSTHYMQAGPLLSSHGDIASFLLKQQFDLNKQRDREREFERDRERERKRDRERARERERDWEREQLALAILRGARNVGK